MPRMRWTLRIGLLLGLLLLAYSIWPFIDLYRLGRAVEARDATAVAARIELRALRPSVSRQVFATYLRLTGNEARLGGIARDFVIGAGAALADSAIAEMMTVERLLDIVTDGLASRTLPGVSRWEMVPRNLGGLWRIYADSEYRLDDFYVSLPPAVPPSQRFRMRLRLLQWTWKLHDVELPEDVRQRLAEELIKQTEKR